MTWVRLDDRFTDNPKVARLSDKAFRVYVTALCYSAGTLSDGHVPRRKALEWGSLKTVGEILAAGLWEEAKFGYSIHDFLDYQQSREQINARRMQNASAAHSRWDAVRTESALREGLGNGNGSGDSDFADRLIRREGERG